MKESIISKPGDENAKGGHEPSQFEFFEATGRRPSQEDALAWHLLPDEALQHLSPEEIGFRLWTCYRQLDAEVLATQELQRAGTTASTTVYDGRGNLITATLADAVSFAAVFDKTGRPRGVLRLNEVTHCPDNPDEKERIIALGGHVTYLWGIPRVNGSLAVSRAIGDRSFKRQVSSHARIDVHSTDSIRQTILSQNTRLRAEDIGEIKIIMTCDGFTEPAITQTKADHEDYLLSKLHAHYHTKDHHRLSLSEYLVGAAMHDGSGDNISVSIQTLPSEDQAPIAVLQGVYDGHGGAGAAHLAAERIGALFLAQCALRPEEYASQRFSVMRFADVFQKDHADYFRNRSGAASSSNAAPVAGSNMADQFARAGTPDGLGAEEPLELRLAGAMQVAYQRYCNYHSLNRADKTARQDLNRGQGDGYLSFFRHRASGLQMAAHWNLMFEQACTRDDSLLSLLLCLNHPNTRFYRHSFGSYVLDAIRPVLDSENIAVPVLTDRENLARLSNDIATARQSIELRPVISSL